VSKGKQPDTPADAGESEPVRRDDSEIVLPDLSPPLDVYIATREGGEMSMEDSYIEDIEIDLERAQMLEADLRTRLAAVKAERDRLRDACNSALEHTRSYSGYLKEFHWESMAQEFDALAAELSAALATPTDAGIEPRQHRASAAESPGTLPGGSS
jgi:hypothetical protein